MSKQFEVKSHSYQIADTGDYDGYWEITNGEISLQTNDDGDDMDKILGTIAKALNESECKFHLHNSKEIDLYCECEGLKIQLKEQATRAMEREKVLVEALKDVAKWEFATDGRKFNGDHKEVLKWIVSIASKALANYAGEGEVGNG